MKKKHFILPVLIIFSIIFLMLSLMNFANPIAAVEGIEQNYFVLALGIDKGIEEGNVRITITSEKFSSTGDDSLSSSSQTKSSDTITSEGKTLFEASRKFDTFYSKKIFWGQIEYVIIGEDVAKEDILDYLDFCVRGHELRFDTLVAIAKGTTAEAVLRSDKKNGNFVPDVLDGIFKNSKKLSISKSMEMRDVITMFDNKYASTYIPTIEMVTKKESKKEENKDLKNDSSESESSSKESEKKDQNLKLEVNGFALFNKYKLSGYISGNLSRGLNFINGDTQSAPIVLEDKNNNKATLEILSSKPKIEVELKNNIPKANILLEVSSNFSEELSQDFKYDKKELDYFTEKQNELIKGEMENTLKYLQENSFDSIGIGDKIYHKYPLEWDKIKDNWKELFKNMEINVTVKSKINRTYHIEETIGSNE